MSEAIPVSGQKTKAFMIAMRSLKDSLFVIELFEVKCYIFPKVRNMGDLKQTRWQLYYLTRRAYWIDGPQVLSPSNPLKLQKSEYLPKAMTEASPRGSFRGNHQRGRGGASSPSFRAGRGGSHFSRQHNASSPKFGEVIEEKVKERVGETEETKKLRTRYEKVELKTLKELFGTEWSEEDLLFVLGDTNGDVEEAITRISDGTLDL
jgi:hypothetical protein